MTISVVVVSRSEGEWLRGTVDGLLATLPDGAEIVVVDDDSVDGSAENLPARVRVIEADGVGVTRARNLGAGATSGEVLVFCDGHMRFPMKGWWEPLVGMLEDASVGAAAPAMTDTEHRMDAVGYGFTLPSADLGAVWLRQPPERGEALVLPGACMAVRREFFERAGRFDEGLEARGCVDVETCLRFWRMGGRCVVVPDVQVQHQFRVGAPFRSSRTDMIRNRIRTALVHFDEDRLSRVMDALREEPGFEGMRWKAESGNWWDRRRWIEARSQYNADWIFQRFALVW